MKTIYNFISVMVLAFASTISSYSQDHLQPCHGQDTSHVYKIKSRAPVALAISADEKIAVAGHNWYRAGGKASIAIWNDIHRFMSGLHPNDTFSLTAPGGLAYDASENLYITQAERADSNVLVYNSSFHLIQAINNSPGTPQSWNNLRGIAIDGHQDLYVISSDSVTTRGADIPKTGKLIKISHALTTPVKTVLLSHLNAPKAVAITGNDLFISEYGNNKVSRFNLSTMAKTDSVSVIKPMDLFANSCRLYCSEHDSNTVKVFDEGNLSGRILERIGHLDKHRGPFGLALDNDESLLVCDSNHVLFYSDSEGTTDTDIIYSSAYYSSSGGGGYVPNWRFVPVCMNSPARFVTLFDTARYGIWHNIDSTSLALRGGVIFDSVANVMSNIVDTFRVSYTHGSITDTFYVPFTPLDTTSCILLSDTGRGGTWFTYDSSKFILEKTHRDSVIKCFWYGRGSGFVYYRTRFHTDTFFVIVDSSRSTPGRIYAGNDTSTIYDSCHICINNIGQLFEETPGLGNWSIDSPSIAYIDQADGTVWPLSAGTAMVTYTIGAGMCGGGAYSVFKITVDPSSNSGVITGPSVVCHGATLSLVDTTSGGTWSEITWCWSVSYSAIDSALVVNTTTPDEAVFEYSIDNNCIDASDFDLIIQDNPNAGAISGPNNICGGTSTYFTSSTTDPGGYWTSSNPSIASISGTSDSCLVSTYYGAGHATITYTDTNSCGTSYATSNINVVAPDTGHVVGTSNLCIGSTASYIFTDTNYVTGVWYTYGSTISVSSFGVVTATSPGTTSLCYYDFARTCRANSFCHPVTTYALPDAGTLSGPTVFCPGSYASISSSAYGGNWSASNTHGSVISSYVYENSPGIDTFYYVVSNYCGTDTAKFVDSLFAYPDSGSISGPVTICSAVLTSYSDTAAGGIWSTTNSLATISASGVVTGHAFGMDTLMYTVSNACATVVAIKPIHIDTPLIAGIISGPSSVCVGSRVVLIDSNSGGTWSATNAHAMVSGDTVTGRSAGVDTVRYSMSNVCGTSTAFHVVGVNPLASVSAIIGPSVVCPGSRIVLSDSSAGGSWTATNARAFVSHGVVSGVVPGTDTIVYTIGNMCDTVFAIHQVVVNPLPDSGTITGSSQVCQGTSITLTDASTGGGWTASNGHATVTAGVVTGVTNGVDTIYYAVHNYCGTATTYKVVTVNPTLVPSVNFSVSRDTLCSGDSVTFTPTSVNGGTSPVYQWEKFSTLIGSGASFRYAPAHGDVIKCVLVSNALCASPDTVTSATVTMVVNPTVTPMDSISTSVGDSVSYIGQSVTFNTEISYCGTATTYQWYLNGEPIAGATGNSYSSAVFNNDTIYCINTCNAPCATRNRDTSNRIIIYADYLTTSTIYVRQTNVDNITLSPNPNKGSFDISGKVNISGGDQVNYVVLDLVGKAVLKGNCVPVNGMVHEHLNLGHVVAGQYILKVYTENDVEFVQFVVEQ